MENLSPEVQSMLIGAGTAISVDILRLFLRNYLELNQKLDKDINADLEAEERLRTLRGGEPRNPATEAPELESMRTLKLQDAAMRRLVIYLGLSATLFTSSYSFPAIEDIRTEITTSALTYALICGAIYYYQEVRFRYFNDEFYD